MTRQETVELAIKLGWKPWGKLRKYGHSSYQCFRRRAKYCWIGLRFIDHPDDPMAIDFVIDWKKASGILR